MQPYPRSPDLVWPGHLHGTGCLSARAMDTGVPTVLWRWCLGPGCAWVWVSVTPPALSGVLGGCVWVRFVVSPLFSPLGFAVFAVGLGFRPAPLLSWLGLWDMRCCVRAPPAPRRSRFWCAVWACVLGSGLQLHPASPWGGLVGVCVRSCVCPTCPRPSCGPPVARGCAGVFVGGVSPPPLPFGFFGGGFVVSVAGCPGLGSRGLCPPIPSLPGRVVCCLFVFSARCVSACFGCPFSRWAAALGLVLPVLAGWSPGAPLGGPVFGAVWVGGLAPSCGVGGRCGGCGLFSRPPPPSPLFFLWGGGSACSSLCLPWTGARTGRHSVWLSGLLLVVAFCQAVPRPHGLGGLCTLRARRPFLPG